MPDSRHKIKVVMPGNVRYFTTLDKALAFLETYKGGKFTIYERP